MLTVKIPAIKNKIPEIVKICNPPKTIKQIPKTFTFAWLFLILNAPINPKTAETKAKKAATSAKKVNKPTIKCIFTTAIGCGLCIHHKRAKSK